MSSAPNIMTTDGGRSALSNATGTVGRVLDLLEETDLQPSPQVNALFSQLVAIAQTPDAEPHMLSIERLCRLRQICAIGEGNLEHYWARHILCDPQAIQRFPYLDNYHRLVAHEAQLLSQFVPPGARIIFLGSGPLPLTALLLGQYDYKITLADRDEDALELGAKVIEAVAGQYPLTYPEELDCLHCDAVEVDSATADVVVVAALVGEHEGEKPRIAEAIAQSMRSGAVLAARSVPLDGRRLLYPPFPRMESSTLQFLTESEPPLGVINSLAAYRVR